MKFKRTFSGKQEYDVGSAIVRQCDGSDYNRGKLETVEAGADKTLEFLAKLTELLHSKGVISNEEISDLLGYGWEKI
jgi:hypothetical protein